MVLTPCKKHIGGGVQVHDGRIIILVGHKGAISQSKPMCTPSNPALHDIQYTLGKFMSQHMDTKSTDIITVRQDGDNAERKQAAV